MSDRYLRGLLREAQQGLVPLQDYVAAALRVMPPEVVIADLDGFAVEAVRLAMRLVWIPVYADISKETKTRAKLAIALEAGETDFPHRDFFERNQSLLSDKDWRLFAADCAEHVLHHWESAYPDDDRPRTAIDVARRFARGEATEQELDAAWSDAWDAAWSAVGSAAMAASWYAADYAAWSAVGSAGDATESATWSASHSAALSTGSASGSAAQQSEIAWQAARLADYLVDLSALPPPVTNE